MWSLQRARCWRTASASGPCLIFEWQKQAPHGVLHIPPLSGPAGRGAPELENEQNRSAKEEVGTEGKREQCGSVHHLQCSTVYSLPFSGGFPWVFMLHHQLPSEHQFGLLLLGKALSHSRDEKDEETFSAPYSS